MTKLQQEKVTEMFDHISNTYDRVNSILSLGLHKSWRNQLIQRLPKQNNLYLLDIATGTGDVLIQSLKKQKASMGVGVDLAQKMLDLGEKKLKKQNPSLNAQFKVANAESLPFKDAIFDATTISFGIRNVENPLNALKEMYRVIKPGGRCLVLEFSLPKNKLIQKLHLFYLRNILPKVGGFFSKSSNSYVYLNQTIEVFPYSHDFLALMRQAGFSVPKQKPLTLGVATLYWADK